MPPSPAKAHGFQALAVAEDATTPSAVLGRGGSEVELVTPSSDSCLLPPTSARHARWPTAPERSGTRAFKLQDADQTVDQSFSPSDFGALDFGRVEFAASKRMPAKWARFPAETSSQSILQSLIASWRLPAPSVIISVTGGAKSLELNDKQKLVFRRGLLQAAKQASAGGGDDIDGEVPTTAWIVTGGTQSGVMELVGRAVQGLEIEDPPIPCIGIAPWGIVSQRAHMAAANERVGGRATTVRERPVVEPSGAYGHAPAAPRLKTSVMGWAYSYAYSYEPNPDPEPSPNPALALG